MAEKRIIKTTVVEMVVATVGAGVGMDNLALHHSLCQEQLRSGSKLTLTAAGISMWPVITEGTEAVIAPLDGDKLPKGALILIGREDKLYLHRYWQTIYHEGKPLIKTKGDTNALFDPPVPMQNILGQVTTLKRKNYTYNPKQGLLRIYGRLLCSSYLLARVWAKVCRVKLAIDKIGG